jgi:hypothetical protein
MIHSGPASLVLCMPLISGAFFFLLLDKKMALYISTANIIGACTGAITSVAVTITKELFGTKGFATNYNLLIANIPLGSLAFGYARGCSSLQQERKGCMHGNGVLQNQFHYLGFFLCRWNFPCFNPLCSNKRVLFQEVAEYEFSVAEW